MIQRTKTKQANAMSHRSHIPLQGKEVTSGCSTQGDTLLTIYLLKYPE